MNAVKRLARRRWFANNITSGLVQQPRTKKPKDSKSKKKWVGEPRNFGPKFMSKSGIREAMVLNDVFNSIKVVRATR